MIERSSSSPPEQAPSPAVDPEVVELKLQLADRERQLAALTEQSLQILDRLAEAREEHADSADLRSRINELQELLADTRQRIRMASRVVLAKGLEHEADCEIVIWGVGAGDGETIDPLLAAVPDAPVTLLLHDGVDPSEFQRERPGALSVQSSERRSPAHAWNEAMATSQAEVVVVLVPDAVVQPGDLARLEAAAAADGVAIASPCLVHPEGRSLGRRENSLLELTPLTVVEGTGVEPVPFASPEAFAVSRQAYHRLGMFDQDLVGDLALAEWSLRSGKRSYRCVGVRDAEVRVAALRVEESTSPSTESDRLVVLSRHRPRQLASATLASQSLWTQEPMAVANALRSVFQRLPKANELSNAVDLLVVQAQTIAGWKRLAPELREQLVAMAGAMGIDSGDDVSEPGLVDLAERIYAEMTGLDLVSLRELGQSGQSVHGELSSLRQDIIARANTIDRLRQELIEREQAIGSLKEEHGKRVGERDRLIDHLGTLQAQIEGFQQQTEGLQQQLHGESFSLQNVLGEIEDYRLGNEQLREQRDILRSERSSLQEQRIELESRAHELVLILRDRERWIVKLLQEVQLRRFQKRGLTKQEADFLARQGFGMK